MIVIKTNMVETKILVALLSYFNVILDYKHALAQRCHKLCYYFASVSMDMILIFSYSLLFLIVWAFIAFNNLLMIMKIWIFKLDQKSPYLQNS